MMHTSEKALFTAAAMAALAVAQAQAPQPPTETGDPSTASTPHQREALKDDTAHDPQLRMAHQDGMVPEKFAKNAALAGMTEVELGKLALAQSQDPKIRQFAQQMVADHGKANAELTRLAKSKNVQLPTRLDGEHQAMVQTLSAKSGAAFDTAYSEHMAKAHAKAVALFDGASMGSDAEFSSFAKKTLPTLKEHKEMADALAATRS